ESILHETSRRWKAHVRRARRDQEKIDILSIDVGRTETALSRFGGQVRSRLVRQSVAALENASLLDDPFAITAETLLEMTIADEVVGHIARHREDGNAL